MPGDRHEPKCRICPPGQSIFLRPLSSPLDFETLIDSAEDSLRHTMDPERELPVYFYLGDKTGLPFYKLRFLPPICYDTSSDQAVAKTRVWLKECFKNHKICPDDIGSVQLPKRTLMITADKKVQLCVHEAGATGSYICLSHCWGSGQIMTTTRETLASRQQGVEWNDLPKTFQEVLDFVYRLGISHVWIGSLCIIQDDRDDWAEQSFQMAAIYRNSYLTIAAAASQDGTGGIFRQNNTPAWEAYEIPRDEQAPDDGDNGNPRVFARLGLHTHHLLLFDRGWTFQEELLPPRILYFTEHELAWVCAQYPKGDANVDRHRRWGHMSE